MENDGKMFDRDCCVAVTGAAGFVGGRTVYGLDHVGYSRLVATDLHAPGFDLPAGVEFSQMDITDKESVRAFFEKHRPKAVLNIAALFDFKAPQEILDKVNVDGPMNLLEVGSEYGLERLVQISSGTVYKGKKMLEEDDPFGPIEPYGESKLRMETALADYMKNNFPATKLTILRPSVIYGPPFPAGSRYGATLALFSQYAVACLTGSLTAYPIGGEDNEACYVHVDDVVGALQFVLEKEIDGVFNIVDQTPVTHKQLGQIVLDALDLPWYRRILEGKRFALPKQAAALGAGYERIMPTMKRLGITIPLDKGGLDYSFAGDFSMSPAKLVSHGFVHKHPSSFRSMPPVIREYAERNWDILVGPTTAKMIGLMRGRSIGLYQNLMSRLGLGFSETMKGEYTSHETGATGKFEFSIDCDADLYGFIHGGEGMKKRELDIAGILKVAEIEDGGVVGTANIEGKLVLFDGMYLHYEFDYTDPFTGDRMNYKGQKDVTPLHPISSMTTLYGRLYRDTDKGLEETASVLSYFDLRDIFSFLGSFGLRR